MPSQVKSLEYSEGNISVESIDSWVYDGKDEFSELGDRLDAAPLPLPVVGGTVTVTLVRHGQSTWNARNRVQGSSNFSVLTEKGVHQAEMAAELLKATVFGHVFVSPLARARQTADKILERVTKKRPEIILPSLREIDLYSFQGMDKFSKRAETSAEYAQWKANPSAFEIDGHAPVRELWYRASLAWQCILSNCVKDTTEETEDKILVVAHNAVNQALLCTAIGLPPELFRRITQSNAAYSQISFTNNGGGMRICINCTNSFPSVDMLAREILPNSGKAQKILRHKFILVCSDDSGDATLKRILEEYLKEDNNTVPCVVAMGTPSEQAADVMTTVEATLSAHTSSTILAAASSEACNIIIKSLMDIRYEHVCFMLSPGSVSILSIVSDGSNGTTPCASIICTNYSLPF
jgi:broad specificity phosphatase PhoE